MTEYKVRALETGGTADVERECNELARDGWRLVSTAAANTGGIKVGVWLFFEREVTRPPDDHVARMVKDFAVTAAAIR